MAFLFSFFLSSLQLFSCFFENFRRRSVRVLKLNRGFILTKKVDIKPKKNLKTPLGPLEGVFFKLFF
jgi:hypothetical protein